MEWMRRLFGGTLRLDQRSAPLAEVEHERPQEIFPDGFGVSPLDGDPKIAALPEGSLYVAGGIMFFTDREVMEAAQVLAANDIEYGSFESRAAIIRHARNEYPSSFPHDDLTGYYEDFPL
jgi:hypothetical protein